MSPRVRDVLIVLAMAFLVIGGMGAFGMWVASQQQFEDVR